MKRVFRYLLAFEAADGSMNVVEFNVDKEFRQFQAELSAQGISSKLINERKLAELLYKKANYIDMKE